MEKPHRYFFPLLCFKWYTSVICFTFSKWLCEDKFGQLLQCFKNLFHSTCYCQVIKMTKPQSTINKDMMACKERNSPSKGKWADWSLTANTLCWWYADNASALYSKDSKQESGEITSNKQPWSTGPSISTFARKDMRYNMNTSNVIGCLLKAPSRTLAYCDIQGQWHSWKKCFDFWNWVVILRNI